MATPIIMPKVDMVMETGTLVEWLKHEGDTVQKGESIFIMLTEKSSIEVESPASGILAGLTAKADDVVPVSAVVGYILKPGESLPTNAAAAPVAPAAAAAEPAAKVETAAAQPVVAAKPAVSAGEVRATPLARSLAKELGVDLAVVPGSGPKGRIYRSDLERFVASNKGAAAPTPAVAAKAQKAAPVAAAGSISLPNARVKERIPLKGVRTIIAERMSYSFSTTPHIYETVSVDMTEIVRLRERILPVIQEQTGLKVSYTAIMAYIIARELTKFPMLNSSFNGDEIVQWEDVNLGIATSLEDYLIVPVVKESQSKDLKGMVVEMARLLDRARSHKLEPSEMSGSTFTISNLGMFGIEEFTAIINPPEAAILAVGKMMDTPVVVNGKVEVRPMIRLTVGADHRILDGALVARFLSDLKSTMENPYLLF